MQCSPKLSVLSPQHRAEVLSYTTISPSSAFDATCYLLLQIYLHDHPTFDLTPDITNLLLFFCCFPSMPYFYNSIIACTVFFWKPCPLAMAGCLECTERQPQQQVSGCWTQRSAPRCPPVHCLDSQFAKDQLCTNSTQCGSTVRHGHNTKGAIIVWKLRETFQRECLSCKLPYPRRSPTRQGTLGCCVTLRVLCRGRAHGAGVRVQDAFYPSPIYTPGKESAEGCAAQPKAVTAPPWLLHCATLLPV